MRSRMLPSSGSEANPVLARSTMPWIFVSTLDMVFYKSIAFLWKSLSFLSRNALLVLVLWFIWKLLGGFPMLANVFSWLWKNCRRPSFCPAIPPKLLSLAEWLSQKGSEWLNKIVEGIKHKVFARLQDSIPERTPGSSVRQLLCDDVACKVCERAAQEASQLMSGSRAGSYSFPGFRAPLSHGPCVGHPLQLDTPDSFPQSASAPAPISGGDPLTPTRPTPCGRPLQPPSFPAEDREETFSVAERVSEGSRGSSHHSGDLVGQEEEVLFLSSTTHEMSEMSWRESVSELSELSFSSWEEGKSCRCRQVPRKPRKRRRDSSWARSSAESQASGRDTESFFLRMRMYSQSSPSEASHGRGRKTMASRKGRREGPCRARGPSPSRAQAFTFTAADISFLDKAVVASLESHLLGKRLQHLLGLPPVLLRSLRGFVPSAPRPAPQRGPVGVTVVTDPQALSFVAESARKRLELHLKKMVQMKHWQLPQRAQEALRHMKPPSLPRETAAIPPKKRTPSSSKTLAKESCSGLSCARQQQVLQRNLAKRALEMQLGLGAPKFQLFQKASPKALKPALPKVIPPGLRPPEPRSQQIHFLDLQALGHIQLNITHKKLTHCLGLPSLYHRSLAQLFPDAAFPAPTCSLPRRSAAFGFTSTQIRFLCLKAREELEWHVRRKTLQHAWGLPGLVQRSLRTLLSTCHQVRPRNAKAGQVSISASELPFLSRAIKGKLEKNVQKRILHQRWQLPQRVLDSIKLLYPQGQLSNITGPKPCAVGWQRRQKAQRMVAPAPPLFPPTQLAKTQVVLRLHLTKKSLEVDLEVFPAAVRVSWRYMLLAHRRPLPKVIRPGHKPLLPRRPLPLFAEQMSRIEVAVKCSHLASLWGLGTRYAEALRAMRTPGPPRQRRRDFTFSGVQVTILPRTEAEALERHISRKRLQHEWGFPVLVQRSLRYLVCEPPSLLPRRQTGVSAHILVQDLFLPQSFRNRLELHVQKMKLQRLWGLPRRVVESLRKLRPEFKAAPHQQKSTPRKAEPECLPVSPVLGTLCTVCRHKRKTGAGSRGFPGMGSQNLEKIRVHSAKKSMEVHWEIFPPVAVSSWRRAVLTSRQPLPKRVLRGAKPLQTRKHTPTFVLAEDIKRIEVSVQRHHLSSLWGLGQRYVEALAAMTPAPHPQPPRCRKASLGFSQVQTLFLHQEDRESLERHVRKKKLQHEWGFPVSVQSSLRAFMQSPLPRQILLAEASRKIKVCVQALHGELLFLPRSTRVRLEHHIQRLKLQRQWALPRRILESMQMLFPGKKMLLAGSSSRESSAGACAKPWTVGSTGVEPGREKGRRMDGVAAHSVKLCLPLEGMSLERLQLHVTKKSLEVRLGAFPAVPRRSRQRASLSLSQALPRLSRPGSAPLKSRRVCLLFGVDQMGQIELAVQHSYMLSLWGLGTRYVEAVAAMAPQPPFRTPVRRRGAVFEFLAVETLFFQRLAREELELHIRKKRIQHLWEFPALVQRSLWGFMQGPPRLPGLPKTSIQICVLHQELLFLPQRMCNLLEFHIQRRKLQRRWGLPRKVLDSLQLFLPTAPPGRAPLPQSDKEKKLSKAELSTAGSWAADTSRRKTCHVPPVKRQCLESSTGATLETHLKKKALESKFQLMTSYKALAGPIRRAPLPKPSFHCSEVRPRRPLLLFLEQEALLKIQLNIKQKHLMWLWGLPSLQVKSLAKMYGKVPGLPGKVTTVGSSAKVLGRETSKGLVATGLKPRRWGASFLTRESSDLLEMHILRKRLQHKWGLPATIQKSLSAFPTSPSKLQRSPTHAVDIRVRTTQHPVFLDPITVGSLEAHMRHRTAAHRWGLPKVVQESLKMFLPPGSIPQGNQAQIPPGTCSRDHQDSRGSRGWGLQTAISRYQTDQVQTSLGTCSRDHQRPRGSRGWGSQTAISHYQTDQAQTPLGTCSRDHQRPRGSRGWGPQTAISHYQADQAQIPHCTCSRDHQDPRGSHGQGLQAAASPPQADQTQTLLWTCSKVLQMSLDSVDQGLQAARGEDQSPLENQVEGEQQPRAGRQPSELSPGGMHLETQHGREAPRTELDHLPVVARCLTDEAREYLEFHVKRKRVQHEWSLPSTVQKSLRAFAPPPPELQGPAKARGVVFTTLEKLRGQGKGGAAAHPPRSAIEAVIPRRILRFLCPNVKDCLETHVKRWATEHKWGLPKMVRRSVRAAAPAQQKSSEGDKKHPARLSKRRPDSPRRQEIHSHSEGEEAPGLLQTGKRRYPGQVSRRPRDSSQECGIHSHSEGEEAPGFLHAGERKHPVQVSRRGRDSSQQREIHSHPQGGGSMVLQPSKKAFPQKPKGHQRKQGPARKISPTMKPHFLTDEALQLLEFHVIHKRIQHAWATPSLLQKSLDALAPFAPHLGGDAHKTHRWGGTEVRAVTNDLSFLKPDTKERLEAHIRTLTTRHRWEIPKRVQQSLRTFLGSRPPSQSEVGQGQALFPCQCKSWQVDTDDYQTSDDGNKDTLHGAEGRRRATKKPKSLSKGQRGTATGVGHEENVFSFPGVRLPFLQHEAQNVLELHIQRKKLQHAWGLPSAVLRSLQAFSPFPLESPKRPPRKSEAHQIPWGGGNMQVVALRSLSFLSPERKEHLNGHLRRMIQKRRWGLPERVQQSLRAFMLSRPGSQPELDQPPPSKSHQNVAGSETEGSNQLASETEGDNEGDSAQEAKPSREATEKKPKGRLHHKREIATAHVDVSTFFFPEVTSPFLPHEAQNALEFHIRHKRLQHAWGLPSAVLKSLQAFAPLPLESHKQPPRKSIAHPLPWDDGNIRIMTRGLKFINPVVKERLEAHVASLTAGHRWGLPKHVQKAMRAFRLPRPPSVVEMGMETQPCDYQEASLICSPFELGSSGQKHRDRQNVPGELEEEELLAATPSATSTTSINCERELPFLAGHLQDFLEFHIQRKKIQHDWGLPATVQRSVRAFAPVPRGLQESSLPGTRTSIAAARAKGVAAGTRAGTKRGQVGKEVHVGPKQLHFLHVGTKEHLEKHIRGLKAGHRWHVPKMVQESARAFRLRAHGPEEEEEEEPSVYNQTLDTSGTPFKTETGQESSTSWEEPGTYHTEHFPDLGQDSGEASWVEAEELSLCLCGKTYTAAQEARGSWKAGREAPRRSRLQQKPLQGSGSKKPRQVQRSRIPDGMQEPGVRPLPQPTRRPQRYVHNASRRPERTPSSQRVRYTCGRSTHLAARSSNTSLGKRKKKTTRVPWQPEGSFEEMADDSPLPPGQLLPKGSEAGWEHRKDCKLPNCSCPSHFLRKATATTSSSSQLAAERKWRQQEEEESAEDGKEAEGGSPSLLSENIGQVPGPSSGGSFRDASLPEQEVSEADLRPLQRTGSRQQSSLFAPHQALGAFSEQGYAVESQSSYEDVVARNYRMAGSIRQVKSRNGLGMAGRKVGWGREKRMDWPSQTMGDANWATETGRQASSATGELGRWSSESLCQECCSVTSPSWKEGSEEDSAGPPLHQGARGPEEDMEVLSNSPKDSEWQVLPASPNEGFLGTEGGSPRHPAPSGSPLQAGGDEAVEAKEEQGTSSSSEEQRPVSMGSMSQFSTECEWEEIGDWGSKEEGFARSNWLVEEEEEEGEGSRSRNWPGAGREVMGSHRRENSPTGSHSLASLKKARASQTALLWEARFALSNTAKESASEHLRAQQQARAKEATEGPTTSRGSGERRSRYSQLAGKTPSDEKVSLLSQILERKLSLDQGLRVLSHRGERQSKQENSGL